MYLKNKNQIFYALIVIAVVSVISISGVLYYKYDYSKKNSEKKVTNHNNVKLDINGDKELYVNNTYPMSDKLGKDLDVLNVADGVEAYLEFSVVNDTEEDQEYDLYITKSKDTNNEIKPDYIKIYLTDISGNPFEEYSRSMVPTFTYLNYISDLPSSKLLYNGTISSKSRRNFIIRVWVSDSYVSSLLKEEFKLELGVRSV